MTGQTNGQDSFTKVPKIFGNKILSSFFDADDHINSFRLDPSAKGVVGVTAADVTDVVD